MLNLPVAEIDFMFDISNDEGLETLKKISSEEAIPEFVKQAEASLFTMQSELPKEAYALESKRMYPIFDKASTWLSSRYFLKSAEQMPDLVAKMVFDKIKAACELYSVKWPESLALENKIEKLASECYAMNEVSGDTTVLKYPMNTKEAVEISARKFNDEHKLFPMEWRAKTARNLNVMASHFQLSLPEGCAVVKYSCENKSDEQIKTATDARSRLVADKEFTELYKELGEKAASIDGPTAVRALEVIDRASGVARYWDNGIMDPYLSVYKKAALVTVEDEGFSVREIAVPGPSNDKSAGESVVLADRSIPLSTLESMPLEWYSEILGEDIAKEIASGDDVDSSKLKVILSSLPRPSQLLLVSHLGGKE